MTKRLISIRVSDETQRKMKQLKVNHGTITEVVAVAVDRLHREETMDIQKWDRVLIDGRTHGTVVQDGCTTSLVSTKPARESGCTEQRDWYDNARLTVTERRREKATGGEPESITLY